MKIAHRIFVICQLAVVSCYAQLVPSPDVKCVSVAPNGDVTLSWTLPAPGSFVSYHIDTSSFAAGPFYNYTTIPTYTTTSGNHIGAGANTKRMYYIVYTESTGPTYSAPKDTFSTIFLKVTNLVGSAKLDWNKISNQPISTSTNWYKIYREYPIGVWTFRDSTQNLTYTDVTDICNDTLSYRIEIEDNTNCTSVSNVDGGIFQDNTPPVISPIDTVSVDAAGKATISWYLSPSPDADSTIIYLSNAGWTKIKSVSVPLTFYQYPLSNASTASEQYRIAFRDSCGNLSPMGILHKTIFLTADFDVCAATVSLEWNNYVNMNPAVTQYQILKSVNGNPYTLLATIPSNDTNYLDTGLSLGSSYCYFIRATNGTKTSSSNKACFAATVSQPPAFNYNRFATVLSDKSIKITAHIDTSTTSVKSYNLLRAVGTSGSYSVIKTFLPPATSVLTYTDNGVSAGAYSYSYKWNAMDSCGHIIMSSNFDTSMLLTANIAPNLDITLSWNDYGSFLGNVDHYEIYRAVDEVWSTIPAATVSYSGNGGTFTDDVSLFMNSKGIFYYKVVAIEGTGNTFGFSDSSVSNIAKVYEYPKLYMPNCFSPNGDSHNDIFIPVLGFIEPAEYSFRIFDNTGTQVMGTTIPTEGWDGTKKGRPCMEGVYMYLIQGKASNGDDFTSSGTVTLIR